MPSYGHCMVHMTCANIWPSCCLRKINTDVE
uniref:Uncharacterized protein n=1 Tax=Anguilla anguilla TaxID=7936 RepID=A0A0E9QZ71_ANGAN